MLDAHREKLWAVVDELARAGVSPSEFSEETAQCWEQSLRDRLRDEPDEFRKTRA